MRPHDRPSEPRPRRHRLVDIFDAGHALGHQADRLTPERGLQTIGNMGGNFLFTRMVTLPQDK